MGGALLIEQIDIGCNSGGSVPVACDFWVLGLVLASPLHSPLHRRLPPPPLHSHLAAAKECVVGVGVVLLAVGMLDSTGCPLRA